MNRHRCQMLFLTLGLSSSSAGVSGEIEVLLQGDLPIRQNEQILAEYALARAEDRNPALEACLRLGGINAARGNPQFAGAYFEAVIEEVLPADLPVWARALDADDVRRRWRFVERATSELIRAQLASGEVQGAVDAALELLNAREQLRLPYSRWGYLSLLAAADALSLAGGIVADDGRCTVLREYPNVEAALLDGIPEEDCLSGSDVALALVLWVQAENPESSLRPRCRKRIAELTGCPGALVDPAPLYTAAKAKYDERECEEAVELLKQLLGILAETDPVTYGDYSPPTHFYLGRSYLRLDRHVEATMAFREGHLTSPGNEEWDSYNTSGFYYAARELQREAPHDSLLSGLLEEAERVAAQFGGHDRRESFAFLAAERNRMDHQDFMAALRRYREIPPSSDYYPAAQVYIGVCKYHIAQPDRAYAILLPHLEQHVLDRYDDHPRFREYESERERREQARATGELYRARIEYDRTNYDAVIEHAWDYHLAHPQLEDLAPRAMRIVGHSLIRRGHYDDGQRYLELASRLYPEEPREE